jgi:Zn-dependent protease
VSLETIRFATYLLVGLAGGMMAREYARAWAATRLGDPTPRQWRRLTLDPRSWFDPFGSGLVPALILLLWAAAARLLPPPFAYGKTAPVYVGALRERRDVVLVSVAGPLANVALALPFGIALRTTGAASELGTVAYALMLANVSLAIVHLMPIPGLDGARMVALLLPPRAREIYVNAEQLLPLFVLLFLLVLGLFVRDIVYALTDVLCRVLSGIGCRF